MHRIENVSGLDVPRRRRWLFKWFSASFKGSKRLLVKKKCGMRLCTVWRQHVTDVIRWHKPIARVYHLWFSQFFLSFSLLYNLLFPQLKTVFSPFLLAPILSVNILKRQQSYFSCFKKISNFICRRAHFFDTISNPRPYACVFPSTVIIILRSWNKKKKFVEL